MYIYIYIHIHSYSVSYHIIFPPRSSCRSARWGARPRPRTAPKEETSRLQNLAIKTRPTKVYASPKPQTLNPKPKTLNPKP